MSVRVEETQECWQAIGPLLTIRNERDHAAAIERLQELLDEVGDNEEHPLYGLLDTLGTLIHAYEEKCTPIPDASGAEVLEFLIEEHGLGAEDLRELGAPQTVRDVLAHRRELTIGEIRALAKRFRVSPAVFV